MASNHWPEVRLGDVVDEITVGHVGPMTHEYLPTGIPFLRSTNILPYRISFDDIRFIDRDFHERLKKSSLRPGDVVIVRTGKPGTAAIIPPELVEANCSDLVVIRSGAKVNPRFLAYFVNGIATHQVNAHLVGAVQQHFNVESARQLQIHLPKRKEQDRIAEILGAFDYKIDLNRRMNETLEAMARALFKSWFIDFDPVRARAEGQRPTELDATTAAMFPDRFESSSLGKIPQGWRVGELAEVAEVVMGTSPSGDTYNEDGIGTPLVNGPVEFGDYFAVKRKWTTAPQRMSQSGDLIFCVRGSTTGRRVTADDAYCLGRGVCAIRSKHDANGFVHALIDHSLDRLLSKVTGSVFPNLNGPDIRRFPVVCPSTEAITTYQKTVGPVLRQVHLKVAESRALAETRDALLPKLMSGAIQPE